MPPFGFELKQRPLQERHLVPVAQAFPIRSCPPAPACAVPVISAAATSVAMSQRVFACQSPSGGMFWFSRNTFVGS